MSTWARGERIRESREREPRGRADYGDYEVSASARRNGTSERLAQALGWVSLGLGLAETIAPGRVAWLIGVRDSERTRAVLRLMGAREIVSGIGIFSRPRPARWVWARVGGDVLDLALLGRAYRSPRNDERRLAGAIAGVAGATALDVYAGSRLSRERRPAGNGPYRGGFEARKVITINRSPEEVYRFWKDFPNFPMFMKHLESVELIDARRSRWKAKAPAGTLVEWDAETVEDRSNEVISWRSVEGCGIENRGTVRFQQAPGGRGTEVRVDLQYDIPGGRLSSAILKLFGEEPSQQVKDDLRIAKQLLEVGEIVRSEGSLDGPLRQRPARPEEREIPSSSRWEETRP